VRGLQTFPQEFSYGLGLPSHSKNKWALPPVQSRSMSGIPIISIKYPIYSYSVSPGNNGYPVNNSVRMHAKDHISIE